MADRIIETITSLNLQERVVVVQRTDGTYSFRRQWLSAQQVSHPQSSIGDASELGPYIGIYDSAEKAKFEALCKVEWLAEAMTSN